MRDRTTRRGFFRVLVRTAGLAGLGAVAWRVLSRPGGSASAASLCARCPSLDGCSLPEGERTRRALGRTPTRRYEPAATPGLCGALPKPVPGNTWTRREAT